MGRVFKQKSGKWAIRFDLPEENGARKQKQIGGFSKKSEAEKELIKLEADLLQGTYFSGNNLMFNQFMEIWLSNYVLENCSERTHTFYSNLYEFKVKEYFKRIALTDLKASTVDAFYSHLRKEKSHNDQKKEISATYIHHYHKCLRAALNIAVRWGYLKESPMKRVTPPKLEKKLPAYWDAETIPIALKVFEGTTIEWHVKMALLTGLREGELCALNQSNINLNAGTMDVIETVYRNRSGELTFKPPKTESSMSTLPITGEVMMLIKEKLLDIKKNQLYFGQKYQHDHDGYLSVWEDGKFMQPSYLSHKFHEILAKQDHVPAIRFHDLRHSCASWLIASGVDLKIVQEILRHSDFSLTANTYSHVSQTLKKGALDKLKLGI